ncbi:hypothetical protein GOP47_0000227 [Adiantum capillus-veneris]|uniref:Uncharacterized protein n=1 Tax=Adiantum capillus-veneris TaxID=13818 RepID=A0A9D4VD63_ADICA|nr:hypothetical protein GOP47_0000227 [Adiantum capillus-veneris]
MAAKRFAWFMASFSWLARVFSWLTSDFCLGTLARGSSYGYILLSPCYLIISMELFGDQHLTGLLLTGIEVAFESQ